MLTTPRFCIRSAVELLFVWDVFRDVLQAAIQDRAQLVQRMCRYWHISLEALDSRMAHAVFESQGIGRHFLFFHYFPQWCIVDHHLRPLLQVSIMADIMAMEYGYYLAIQ